MVRSWCSSNWPSNLHPSAVQSEVLEQFTKNRMVNRMVVAEDLLNYREADERKHDPFMVRLETIKRGMLPR